MIVIIDYGVGNLYSLKSSLKYLGIDSKVTADEKDLRSADKIILPGVGAFEDSIKKLKDTGLVPVINEETSKGKPMLGICLGMQLLFDKSYEYGEHNGLGFIKGTVESIEKDLSNKALKVPHIGWNRLDVSSPNDPIFKYFKDGGYVYYVHSFYGKGCEKSTLATSEYDVTITGVVKNGSVYGTQFHPEKSGEVGLSLLQAFSEL